MKNGLVLAGVVGTVALLGFQRKVRTPVTVTRIEVEAKGVPQTDWADFVIRSTFGRYNPETKLVDWGAGRGWQTNRLSVWHTRIWEGSWAIDVQEAVGVTHAVLEVTRLTTAGPVVVRIIDETGRVVASARFENALWSEISSRTLELR